MTTALQSAERHLADLAANGVPARDKPSAFHHGLIMQLVAELRLCETKLAGEEAIRRGYANRAEVAETWLRTLLYQQHAAARDHVTSCDRIMGATHPCTCHADEYRALLEKLPL